MISGLTSVNFGQTEIIFRKIYFPQLPNAWVLRKMISRNDFQPIQTQPQSLLFLPFVFSFCSLHLYLYPPPLSPSDQFFQVLTPVFSYCRSRFILHSFLQSIFFLLYFFSHLLSSPRFHSHCLKIFLYSYFGPERSFLQEYRNFVHNTGSGQRQPEFRMVQNKGVTCIRLPTGTKNSDHSGQNGTEFKTLTFTKLKATKAAMPKSPLLKQNFPFRLQETLIGDHCDKIIL